ncbi:hypothetical protein [uncultured Kocuria sp.]|uniref:hypothetical protein n=1 Tax=uncultured Kocuria sp. TaxID=259305 RepID=UPI00260C21FF|nr:hypothetical protein [uncultured Kocuria sp.]
MRRPVPALLALSALALTGCGPTADDVQAMVDGETAYDDALALREDVVGAGVECPGTDQLQAPADPSTTFLDCANGVMAMAVAGSEESMEELLDLLSSEENASFLHTANWVVISRDETPLQQLQDELGGRITANP